MDESGGAPTEPSKHPRGPKARRGNPPLAYPTIVAELVSGSIDEAERRLDRILAIDRLDADALALSARAASLRNDRDAELSLLRRAVAARPTDGAIHAMLARSLARRQHALEAGETIQSALACAGLSDVALDDLATAYRLLGKHRDAADLLSRAISEGSNNPAIHFNLGNNLKFVGDFDAARTAYRRAIELAPEFHKVHAALAALGGGEADEADLIEIERLIATTADPEAEIHLRHAAAKRCDSLGRYDDAWAHLLAGKARLVESLGADPRAALPAMDRLIGRLRLGDVDLGRTEDPTGPILVVGMPRSGTTVLDRLVSNHLQVESIGESMHFAQSIKSRSGSASPDMLDAPVLSSLDDQTLLAEAGLAYQRRLSVGLAPGTRALDKFHMNFMLAPHLVAAVPRARLLCVMRDPLDTIVGNFRQLFEFRSNIYRYSLDIVAAAEFYVRFRLIADIMQAMAPERFTIVEYERLVAAPEGEARRIFDFCGLPWQPGCSRIELNPSSVATASAVQVRSGIDAGYVGRWRRYADHLHEARRVLASAGLSAG